MIRTAYGHHISSTNYIYFFKLISMATQAGFSSSWGIDNVCL